MAVMFSGLALSGLASQAVARDPQDRHFDEIVHSLQKCLAEEKSAPRLACYDDIARKNTVPRFSGKKYFKTEPFSISRPHMLRYYSEGAIFVLYLLDANGDVVQNLHVGGSGEDSYLIETPGTYALQINGSAGWKIWIDPV